MTSTATAVLAAESSGEGQLPAWLTLAIIAVVLVGGYAATHTTGDRRPERGGTEPRPPEPLGHPLDRIDTY